MEQLGNIGSEVNRAIYWKEQDDKDNIERAVDRVLELIDLTIGDRRWHLRLKEVIRFREIFCDYFFGFANYDISSQALKDYFFPFALRAKLLRH